MLGKYMAFSSYQVHYIMFLHMFHDGFANATRDLLCESNW